MGITKNDIKFLNYARRLGVSFENTLTLGRLFLYAKKEDIKENVDVFKNNEKDFSKVVFEDGYCEPLLYSLGAKSVDSTDVSDYEKATVLHDMNLPIPGNLKNKYTAIIDGGTLEHVFNFPVAIKNCMEALKVGGYYIGITPANNSCGHGFYQFSPELYFRVFSANNGFEVKMILMIVNDNWFQVSDPDAVKSRVQLTNDAAATLIVLARKVEEKQIFSQIPQQSDYTKRWNTKDAPPVAKAPKNDGPIKAVYRKLPGFVRSIIRGTYVTIYELFFKKQTVVYVEGLGKVNPAFYKRINID